MAKDKPFNNPFGALKVQPKAEPQKAAPPAKPQPKVSADDESALFLSAMGAFDPVKPVREPARPAAAAAHQQSVAADDAEALLELGELVAGDGELTIQQSPDAVSAFPKGFDASLAGRVPPKAELDLQGMEREPARHALERFIGDSYAKGLRSVRLITGAASRDLVVAALTRGKLARKVLALWGGVDQLGVLLRR